MFLSNFLLADYSASTVKTFDLPTEHWFPNKTISQALKKTAMCFRS